MALSSFRSRSLSLSLLLLLLLLEMILVSCFFLLNITSDVSSEFIAPPPLAANRSYSFALASSIRFDLANISSDSSFRTFCSSCLAGSSVAVDLAFGFLFIMKFVRRGVKSFTGMGFTLCCFFALLTSSCFRKSSAFKLSNCNGKIEQNETNETNDVCCLSWPRIPKTYR